MKNLLVQFFIFGLCMFSPVFNLSQEFDQVKNLCKMNKDCFRKMSDLSKNDTNKNQIELYKLLEDHFVNYWRQANCLKENEPCGSNWGYCCQELECKLFAQENSINEDIGLCSYSNETYLNDI